MWYMYTMEYYSALKKLNSALCCSMLGSREYYSQWNKSERERQILYITYMWNLEIIQRNVYAKKETHRYKKQTSSYQWREEKEERQIRGMGLRDTNYYL